MKISIFLSVLLGSVACYAVEESRLWTNGDGRTLNGILKAKTATHVEILLGSSKRVSLEIKSLSKEDQKYIAEADIHPEPEMNVKTVRVDSNELKNGYDRRAVEVEVLKIDGRKYHVLIRWLGPTGKTIGVYRSEKKSIESDGKIRFDVVYDKSREVAYDYKGYAVALIEETKGGSKIIIKSASQKPFERFLE